MTKLFASSCFVFVLILFGGCAPYQLRGLVVEGQNPGIEIVDRNDPRLEGARGVPSVDIEVLLDPTRFNPERVGQGQSGRDGTFAVPIETPGAGFLILDVEVQVKRERFLTQVKRFDLPGRGKRLLVTIQPGKDVKPLENPDILEDTLRVAEPYLRNQE